MFEVREIFRPEITEALYAASGLVRPEGCQAVFGVWEGGELLGCAGLKEDVLVGFAVSAQAQGQGLLGVLCTELIRRGLAQGRDTFYIFTRPDKIRIFTDCGFQVVAARRSVCLLEWGARSISAHCASLRAFVADKPEEAACIVMNANPFSLGHLHLARKAAAENPWLHVLVLEEDKSVFPFEDRLRLARACLADMPNVSVSAGGRYVISQLTFPDYFLKSGEAEEAHADMDLLLFGQYVAPALKVSRRYVGEEPYCRVTAAYNARMREMLPEYGIEVVLVPRKKWAQGFISACTIRDLLGRDQAEGLEALVPPATYEFLRSPRGRAIAAGLKKSGTL
ncbi:MAG: GNAT family N-acetyltransferase [Deltaproteobacteria bacterium]|jgi:[citrate (pro-3S)-lyase] ligase|nr:GNAT family N-acetyltransferase [Deltaproteobacteria bacterium]